MQTVIAPAQPRLVTPPMRPNRRALAIVGLAFLVGGWVVISGLTARTDPPRARAVVLERAGSRSLVSVLDGPRPDRFLVDWAGDVPIGEQFTVGLTGSCRCVPTPAVLQPRREPDLATIAIGLFALSCPTISLVRGARLVIRGRRAQRRAEAVVGVGPGPIVRLLPVWTTALLPLHAELWRTDGVLLGRVALGRVDRGFDPHAPFVAWGGPEADGAVALTSVDGHQLVLPTSGLAAATDPPPVDPRVTAAAAALLGWPARNGPTDPAGIAAVDAAVDVLRVRSRWATPVALLLGGLIGATFVVLAYGGWSAPAAIVLLLLIGAVFALRPVPRAALHVLVAPWVGADRKLRAKVVGAIAQARWFRADDGPAHGPATPADGPGWTPSTPAPR